MNEKERTTNQTDNLLFYIITVVIILICFVFLVPKVSSALFPFKRQMIWNNFISSVQKDNNIDPQKFWEFREFYSPGYFTINKTPPLSQIENAIKDYSLDDNRSFFTLLQFHSLHLTSLDTLTTEKDFQKLTKYLSESNIIFQNNNSVIYKIDKHNVIISFLLPKTEMIKANGFFDYREKDKELLKDKLWFDITKVTLP